MSCRTSRFSFANSVSALTFQSTAAAQGTTKSFKRVRAQENAERDPKHSTAETMLPLSPNIVQIPLTFPSLWVDPLSTLWLLGPSLRGCLVFPLCFVWSLFPGELAVVSAPPGLSRARGACVYGVSSVSSLSLSPDVSHL